MGKRRGNEWRGSQTIVTKASRAQQPAAPKHCGLSAHVALLVITLVVTLGIAMTAVAYAWNLHVELIALSKKHGNLQAEHRWKLQESRLNLFSHKEKVKRLSTQLVRAAQETKVVRRQYELCENNMGMFKQWSERNLEESKQKQRSLESQLSGCEAARGDDGQAWIRKHTNLQAEHRRKLQESRLAFFRHEEKVKRLSIQLVRAAEETKAVRRQYKRWSERNLEEYRQRRRSLKSLLSGCEAAHEDDRQAWIRKHTDLQAEHRQKSQESRLAFFRHKEKVKQLSTQLVRAAQETKAERSLHDVCELRTGELQRSAEIRMQRQRLVENQLSNCQIARKNVWQASKVIVTEALEQTRVCEERTEPCQEKATRPCKEACIVEIEELKKLYEDKLSRCERARHREKASCKCENSQAKRSGGLMEDLGSIVLDQAEKILPPIRLVRKYGPTVARMFRRAYNYFWS